MTRWHEANEYGFAGDVTMPEIRRDRPSEAEKAAAEVIPVDDLPRDVAEGVEDATDTDDRTAGEDRH